MFPYLHSDGPSIAHRHRDPSTSFGTHPSTFLGLIGWLAQVSLSLPHANRRLSLISPLKRSPSPSLSSLDSPKGDSPPPTRVTSRQSRAAPSAPSRPGLGPTHIPGVPRSSPPSRPSGTSMEMTPEKPTSALASPPSTRLSAKARAPSSPNGSPCRPTIPMSLCSTRQSSRPSQQLRSTARLPTPTPRSWLRYGIVPRRSRAQVQLSPAPQPPETTNRSKRRDPHSSGGASHAAKPTSSAKSPAEAKASAPGWSSPLPPPTPPRGVRRASPRSPSRCTAPGRSQDRPSC